MMAAPSSRAPGRPLPWPVRGALLLLALLSLGLGIAGVFIPGLPTTVFILIAGWAAARSSPRLAAWLESHRHFGPLLHNWREGGRLTRRAKQAAGVTMALCAVVLFLTSAVWLAVMVSLLMAVILGWLWSRPEPPVADERVVPAAERIPPAED